MSRGHGKTQRAILAIVQRDEQGRRFPAWIRPSRLADEVYAGLPPSAAQIVAVRRAINRLVDEGLLEAKGGGPLPKYVRRPLTEVERKAEQEAWDGWIAAWDERIDRAIGRTA